MGFLKKNKKANWEINLKSTESNFDNSSLTQLKEFITANCPDYGLGLVGAMVGGLDISGGHYVWSCSGENLYGYMIFADVFLQLEDSEDFDFQWNENHILKDQTFIDVEGETAQKSTVFWELLIGNDAGHKRYLKQEDLCISINDEKIPIRDDIDESELTKSLASSEYTATDDFKNEMGGFDFSIGTEPTASDREWSVFEHLTYYFLAFAIFTDGDLDERESAKIYEILCRFTSTENEEELRDEITPIINNAFTKLNSDLEISTDDNPIVQKHLSGLIPHIKSDIPANMHSELVKILIEIGNADGDFSDGEKGWVRQFADDLGLDISFDDEIPEKPKKDEAPADVPVASKKDNAELEVYLNDPKSKFNGPEFKSSRTLIRHIVNDLNSNFSSYRFEYSASMGLSLFGDETGRSKFAGCFIRNKEMVGFDFLRDYENDYRRPKIEGVLVENRRSNQRFIEWYRVFFNSVEQYDENKEKLYSILKSSEKMKMKLSDKLLSKQKFTASDKSKYQKYLDKDYTFELAKEKEKLEPKYIQSTYRDLRNMGFKGYEITYTWDADAEFVDEEMEHWEGSMDCCEIMAPWENISIVKNLFCNDYGLPPDEVDIQEMRELTIDGLVALENFSIGDTITYIAKDDPIYELLDHSTKSVFKGNAPESPDVIQLVTFLYVCVAYLNDGVLSDNEILKMKEKLQASGIEMNDSSKLIIEAHAWWEDAVTKEVQFDDMVECVEQLKNNNAWNENVKESLHSHLTAITTADGVIDMKDGTFAAEKKLKVVDSIMKLFDGEGE